MIYLGKPKNLNKIKLKYIFGVLMKKDFDMNLA